jgi:hypothetical protein
MAKTVDPADKRDRQLTLRLNKTEDDALTIVSKSLNLSEQDTLRKLVMTAAGNVRKGIL